MPKYQRMYSLSVSIISPSFVKIHLSLYNLGDLWLTQINLENCHYIDVCIIGITLKTLRLYQRV